MASGSSAPDPGRPSPRHYFYDLSRKIKNLNKFKRTSSAENKPGPWRGLETSLGALHKSAKLFPPLQSTIGDLTSCLSAFEVTARHRQEFAELATDLEITMEFLRQHLKASKSAQMTDTISSIVLAASREIELISQQQSIKTPSRALKAAYDEEELIRRYRRIEQLFRRLQIEVSMSTWNITNAHLMNTRLENLGPAKLASHDSKISIQVNRRTCTENTRQPILSQLYSWSDNPNTENLFWMSGMAGTGKTTIACSLSVTLESRGQLAASFFCTRSSPECRDASRIMPTIAYQLARCSTPFQSALCQVIEKDPDIASLNISTQFERLIQMPLLEAQGKMAKNLVVVIDALDECDDSRAVQLVLDVLLRFSANLPLKFFVTSRPEPSVRNKMSQNKDGHSTLHLHDIEKSLVQADIELYLQEELAFMSPPLDQIKQLAGCSGNLFIYAATAVRYIRPEKSIVDHKKRLATMLAIDSKSQKKFEPLDMLYSTILIAALDDPNLEPEEQDQLRLVLWTAVCAREPVSVQTLASLVESSDDQETLLALQPLRSVLHISEDSGRVSTLHASFSDYIFSQGRSGRFFCDIKKHSEVLARQCFEVMMAQLRFNICSLDSSFIPDNKVVDLQERVAKNIPQPLSYVCRYWTDHFALSAMSDKLCAMVDEFLARRLLFWMEVLNLKQCMVMGSLGLSKVQTWLVAANASGNLVKLASDAYKFVAGFAAHAVSTSTPHIYVSALALCPKSSSVSEHYRGRMRGLMEVEGSAMERMAQAALATWTSSAPIWSVAYSPDGTQVAFGGFGSTITLQNVQDGRIAVGPFKAHKSSVRTLVFSSDGTRIASGSDDFTVCVWNAQDGTIVAGPFDGHTDSVRSVAFLLGGTRVVSGSDDSTIRVWSVRDQKPAADPIRGHTGSVRSVASSPDGTRIVSGSNDCTIRVWNVGDGTLVAGPFDGHTKPITSVHFSPNGAFILSGSHDRTIRVCSAQTGALIAGPFEGHSDAVMSVGFSSDGARIVSGSEDRTIRVWSVADKTLLAGPFEGHARTITSVGFSPDGARIVSSSHDSTVRMWDTHYGTLAASTIGGHKDAVTSVKFSPDGTRIVSGSHDRTILVWNAHDGKPIAGPFEGHTSGVGSVDFSPDGGRIVSSSDDCTICVWKAHDGTLLIGPLEKQLGCLKSVGYSPDGARIVSASNDRTICIWNARDGTLVAGPLEGHTDWVSSVGFSPNSAHVVSGSDDLTIRVWSAEDGTLIAGPFEVHTKPITSVAFSPDGTRIVSGSDDFTICVWDPYEGTLTSGPFKGHTDSVNSVAFSFDGTRIVSGSSDYTICVWNVHDGTLIAGPFDGHTSAVYSVAFSLDGARVLSGSYDCSIRVWDIQVATQTHATLAAPWMVRADGWFLNRNSELLFWVPAEIRSYFPRAINPFTIGQLGGLQVDHSNMLLGKDWSKCYLDV